MPAVAQALAVVHGRLCRPRGRIYFVTAAVVVSGNPFR
jgi:hypothetical protein